MVQGVVPTRLVSVVNMQGGGCTGVVSSSCTHSSSCSAVVLFLFMSIDAEGVQNPLDKRQMGSCLLLSMTEIFYSSCCM